MDQNEEGVKDGPVKIKHQMRTERKQNNYPENNDWCNLNILTFIPLIFFLADMGSQKQSCMHD